jgi:hypothetical protein
MVMVGRCSVQHGQCGLPLKSKSRQYTYLGELLHER